MQETLVFVSWSAVLCHAVPLRKHISQPSSRLWSYVLSDSVLQCALSLGGGDTCVPFNVGHSRVTCCQYLDQPWVSALTTVCCTSKLLRSRLRAALAFGYKQDRQLIQLMGTSHAVLLDLTFIILLSAESQDQLALDWNGLPGILPTFCKIGFFIKCQPLSTLQI